MARSPRTAINRGITESMKLTSMVAAVPTASMMVLSHRIPMLVAGALDPRLRQEKEEQTMVFEKVEAVAEATAALGKGGVRTADRVARSMKRQEKAGLDVVSAFAKGDAPSLFTALLTLGQRTIENATTLGTDLCAVALETSNKQLTPVHSRVTANAERLNRDRP